MTTQPKKWMGSSPDNCQLCGKPLTTEFVDGKTSMGPWAMMCIECHNESGYGLGVGVGQKYRYAGGQGGLGFYKVEEDSLADLTDAKLLFLYEVRVRALTLGDRSVTHRDVGAVRAEVLRRIQKDVDSSDDEL